MLGQREQLAGNEEMMRRDWLLFALWLTRAGISTDRIALHDGCGLSRLDLVTPEATVQLLLSLRNGFESDI